MQIIIMNTIKNIALGILHGLWDSIRGMTLLLYIDDEVNRLKNEQNTLRELRRMEREHQMSRPHSSRSISPTPSSASAMAREEQAEQKQENPEERHLDSLYKKHDELTESPGEKKIAKKLLKCCLLNGGFTWMSIIIFEYVILPLLKFLLTLFYGAQSETLPVVWSWVAPITEIIFQIIWVVPIYLLSKFVSSLWFADIANAAYRVRKGRPIPIASISKLIADFLFSIILQCLFLLQAMLVKRLPGKYLGETLYFLHLCLLYSLYSFEYKWLNMGWELHRRLSYIENNWPYFLGFGIPLTILTTLPNSCFVSGCIFSICFPLFILSGNEAKPLIGTTNLPVRLFTPVVFLSNICFGARPWNDNSRLNAAQRKQLELQHKQKLLQKQQDLLNQHIEQQKQFEEELLRSRSRSRSNTPTPSLINEQQQQQQHRYAQPPMFMAHKVHSTTSSTATSSFTGFRLNPHLGSTLRPIPVPNAPKTPSSSSSSLSQPATISSTDMSTTHPIRNRRRPPSPDDDFVKL